MTETTTTAAPVMSALAELVLIAMRENLPTPKYMTVSDGDVFKQITLTLNNRADLDAWNAVFGDVRVSECPPTSEARDVLVSTMYGGVLLGWGLHLQTRVPLPMSAEVLASLGEAARSDAAAVLVAGAVAVLDEPAPESVTPPHLYVFGKHDIPWCPACKRESEQSSVHSYTTDGHPCCGLATVGDRPNRRARCGGVTLCRRCSADASRIHGAQAVPFGPVAADGEAQS